MITRKTLATLGCVGLAAAVIASHTPPVQGGLFKEQDYVRLVGGNGYGFCEFERFGNRVRARVFATGLMGNSTATTWLIFPDRTVRLDGTVATAEGDAEFEGHFRVRRGTEVTLDVRDHKVTIQDIGNTLDDTGQGNRIRLW